MSLPLFYFSGDRSRDGSRVLSITGSDALHLGKALRAKQGDEITVGDGRGSVFRATVTSYARDRVEATVVSSREVSREKPAVTMYQAVCEPSRFDEAVRRAAESGAARIVPFFSPRSEKGALEKAHGRLERWEKLAREASMVARRAWPLEVGGPEPRPPVADFDSHDLVIVLWEEEHSRDLAVALPAGTPGSIGVVVGPEGGLSAEDAAELVRAGAVTCGLGDLILRTESAGSYAVMLLRFNYGLLSTRGDGDAG